MPDLQNLLDQIDRLDQEASEAPWQQATDTYDGSEYKTGEVYAEAGTERMQRKFDRMDPDIRCDHGPDAEFIALARTALPQLAEAVYHVLELHKRKVLYKGNSGKTATAICEYCSDMIANEYYPEDDTIYWPCPTVQAITDALGDDDE